VVALLGILCSLCVVYGAIGPVPTQKSSTVGGNAAGSVVGDDRPSYMVSGPVVETDPVVIKVTSGPETRYMTVTDLPIPVEKGDVLRVRGTHVDRDRVRAATAIVTPSYGHTYTYAVSFAAGLWVLYRLGTYWRLDRHQGVVRRSRPADVLSRVWRSTTDSTTEATESDA